MDPSKLKTLVDQQSAGPTAAQLGMAPPDAETFDEDADEAEDTGDSIDAADRGTALLAEWGEFGKSLEEEADMVYDNAHEVGAELLLAEVPEKAFKAVGKSVDRMPDELSMGFAKYIGELSAEDCEALGHVLVTKLDEEEADTGLLCAYLQKAGEYAKAEIEVDEDFNESEEEEDEEEEDEEEAPADGDTMDAMGSDEDDAPSE